MQPWHSRYLKTDFKHCQHLAQSHSGEIKRKTLVNFYGGELHSSREWYIFGSVPGLVKKKKPTWLQKPRSIEFQAGEFTTYCKIILSTAFKKKKNHKKLPFKKKKESATFFAFQAWLLKLSSKLVQILPENRDSFNPTRANLLRCV